MRVLRLDGLVNAGSDVVTKRAILLESSPQAVRCCSAILCKSLQGIATPKHVFCMQDVVGGVTRTTIPLTKNQQGPGKQRPAVNAINNPICTTRS
jgi:hypothetical protein